jgi:hypothetical protein
MNEETLHRLSQLWLAACIGVLLGYLLARFA